MYTFTLTLRYPSHIFYPKGTQVNHENHLFEDFINMKMMGKGRMLFRRSFMESSSQDLDSLAELCNIAAQTLIEHKLMDNSTISKMKMIGVASQISSGWFVAGIIGLQKYGKLLDSNPYFLSCIAKLAN